MPFTPLRRTNTTRCPGAPMKKIKSHSSHQQLEPFVNMDNSMLFTPLRRTNTTRCPGAPMKKIKSHSTHQQLEPFVNMDNSMSFTPLRRTNTTRCPGAPMKKIKPHSTRQQLELLEMEQQHDLLDHVVIPRIHPSHFLPRTLCFMP